MSIHHERSAPERVLLQVRTLCILADVNIHYFSPPSFRNVFVGTGWTQSKVPANIPGIELLDTYDTISIDPADFEGQSVLIFGMGNSAFETALAIYGRANLVHVAGRRRIRLSWETHYVGDIR